MNDKYFDPAFGGKDWQAIDELRDAPALIIDLRGNPGGQFPVRLAIASKLMGEPVLFMRYQRRDGLQEAYLDSVPDPYKGEVVILVDDGPGDARDAGRP